MHLSLDIPSIPAGGLQKLPYSTPTTPLALQGTEALLLLLLTTETGTLVAYSGYHFQAEAADGQRSQLFMAMLVTNHGSREAILLPVLPPLLLEKQLQD